MCELCNYMKHNRKNVLKAVVAEFLSEINCSLF
jgi:hypothetical protein